MHPDMVAPYSQHYSLNVQVSFAQNYLLEVGYVGSKATHVQSFRLWNQAFLASPERPVHGETSNSAANMTARLPFVGLSTPLRGMESTGSMNYNSLQASLTKRFSQGLSFLGSYTYSKSLGTVSTGNAEITTPVSVIRNEAQNQLDLRGDGYGPSNFDRTHRFVLSWVYELPSPGRNGFVRNVLGGWAVSGILVLQSGTPFSIFDGRGATLFWSSGSRASFAEGADIHTARKSGSTRARLNEYFNTSAFVPAPTIPAGGTTPDGFPVSGPGTYFGNTGRNILRGPSQKNVDLALMKRTAVTERSAIEFRAEFFNLFNQPNFRNPGSRISSPRTFGVISSTAGAPRVIQFALKLIF